ncbi:T9SS type A sorting domain-containing protein [bacterium]|nr:T9SS type A sorting domain-containing protein [bacterium]
MSTCANTCNSATCAATCVVSCSYTCTAYPITLVSFDAVPGVEEITLEWITAGELGTYSFIIRRSTEPDGEFEIVGEVLSRVNSINQTYYDFIDQTIIPGITYYYTLGDLNISGYETVHDIVASATARPASNNVVISNYPNPFNPTTTIHFVLPTTSIVLLSVFDLHGRLVRSLIADELTVGEHSIVFDGSTLASGMYVYKLETTQMVKTGKMLLVR